MIIRYIGSARAVCKFLFVSSQEQRWVALVLFVASLLQSAMPPKGNINVATHVKTERVLLSDISLEEDSGWRGVSESHVEEFRKALVSGEYGSTTLARPSLLVDQGNKVRFYIFLIFLN